jgi:2-hydroxychromene-2-carboxylate isomerase
MTDQTRAGIPVDYYFSAISSFAYLGHAAFQELAKKLNLDVTYKPVQLGRVFASSGGLMMGERHPARLRYRLIELQRWREIRGIEMNIEPRFFPTNPSLADCLIIAIQRQGTDPAPLIGAIMQQLWIHEADIAEATTLTRCLEALGLDAESLMARANSKEITDLYEANTEDALANDAVGSPTLLYQGEPFWGQDRFDLFEQAVRSGRAPFSAGR